MSANKGMDDMVHQLDYTYIDLPELIDADADPLPEANPVYTQSVHPFAILPSSSSSSRRSYHQHNQHSFQSTAAPAAFSAGGTDTRHALSMSYWQQLQHFGTLQQSNQGQQREPLLQPGDLGQAMLQLQQQQQQQWQQLQEQQQVQGRQQIRHMQSAEHAELSAVECTRAMRALPNNHQQQSLQEQQLPGSRSSDVQTDNHSSGNNEAMEHG